MNHKIPAKKRVEYTSNDAFPHCFGCAHFSLRLTKAVWLYSLIWVTAERSLWLIQESNWPCVGEKKENSGEAVKDLALSMRIVIILQAVELICESAPMKANVLVGFIDLFTDFIVWMNRS